MISSNWTLDVSINMEKCCPLRVMFDLWCFCCKVFHYAEYIHVIIIFIASRICLACCCCFFFKCGVSNYKKKKERKKSSACTVTCIRDVFICWIFCFVRYWLSQLYYLELCLRANVFNRSY